MQLATQLRHLAGTLTLALAVAAPLHAVGTATEEVRSASGYLIDAADLMPGFSTDTFDVRLTGLTSEHDLVAYAALAQERGYLALHGELSGAEVGRFRIGRDVGLPIALAQERREDGLRRLLLVVERHISLRDLRSDPRALEYPYLVIDLRFDADGRGDGELYPVAKLRVSPDGRISYESWSPQPVRITQLDLS